MQEISKERAVNKWELGHMSDFIEGQLTPQAKTNIP